MSKINILFIINPISGGKSKLALPELISAKLDKGKFDPLYRFTEHVGHGGEIVAEMGERFEVIVAVGGDGTINEVATKVKALGKTLGVVPFGSGNGLSRYLKIPMNTAAAIEVLNNYHVIAIDSAVLNGRHFFNMAGIGFDAHISAIFAGQKGRGLAGYIKLGLREVLAYQPDDYRLVIDGKTYERQAYVISFANSSQYGNNAFISPKASVTDGWLDVCIIKYIPFYKLPLLLYYMWSGKTDQSSMVEIIKGKRISVTRMKSAPVHIDGEPFFLDKDINITMEPLSLNIIVPEYEK